MMNQEDSKNIELVSALADGQLRGDEFAHAVTQTVTDAQSRAAWHAYHVVGDALRSPELADCTSDIAFMARFQERFNREIAASSKVTISSVVAPVLIANDAYSKGANGTKPSESRSANESTFRWKILAGFASFAAVAAIGWNSFVTLNPTGAAAQIAQKSPPVVSASTAVANATVQQAPAPVVSGQEAVMIRDPHLDALMAAHKQFGGTSALQMPAGFLRNATFENNTR